MKNRTILQGEVYICDLDGIDSEQLGQKTVVIIQINLLNKTSPNVIIIPITSKKKKELPTHMTLTKEQYPFFRYDKNTVSCESIRTISKRRLGKLIGRINDKDLNEILRIKEYAYYYK
ncbi:MAG: type II toxin-antitoxin system PemK/MazF family toxin [Bacilli bacterium]